MDTIEALNRSILRRYITGLSLIAILSIGSFSLVQHLLQTQEKSAEIINMSGRQRMLTQRIAFISEIYAVAKIEFKDRYRQELVKSAEQFRKSHEKLSGKDSLSPIRIHNSKIIKSLYFDEPGSVDTTVREFLQKISDLLASNGSDLEALQTIRLLADTTLIEKLDAVVLAYQKQNESEVQIIQYLEFAVLTFTLILLVAEALLIFKPMLKSTKELFTKLTEARAIAVRATDQKSTFLATITHEIRTPLIGVQGIADSLLESQLEPLQNNQIKTVRRMTDTLILLINDILDMSKIESGNLVIEDRSFRLDTMMLDTETLFRSTAEKKGLELSVSIDSTTAMIRRGDPMRINQVLTNLVSNALKFTKSPGRIVVSVKEVESNTIRFEVKDSGIGLSKEQQAKLFNRFVQAENSTARNYGGTGLGLAISKQIIELMGGEIGVDSEIGRGATFWFSLKLSAQPDIKDAAVENENLKNGLWKNHKALVAEDNLVIQMVAVRLLNSLGLDVTVAGDGLEAVAAVQSEDFDIILLDCEMPNMDGFEAAQFIREHCGKQQPILAMSAHISDEIKVRCLEAGMNAYLCKPIKKAQLISALEEWIVKREEAGKIAS